MVKNILRCICVLLMAVLFGTAVSAEGEQLVLPEQLTEIEEEAFFQDTSLGTVVMPEGVLTIGPRAFAGSSLVEITLPGSLIGIAEDAFDGCAALTATVEDGSYAMQWCIAHQVEYLVSGKLHIRSVTASTSDVQRGDTITWEIDAENADEGVSFAYTITLGDETVAAGTTSDIVISYLPVKTGSYILCVTGVDADGYEAAAKPVKFQVGERTDRTPVEAFSFAVLNETEAAVTAYSGTDSVLVLPETVQMGGQTYTVTKVASRAFQNKHFITCVIFPDSYTAIDSEAFSNCSKLENADLPDGLLSISYSAFMDCTSLTKITLPDSLKSIGSGAFNRCSNLEFVNYPKSLASKPIASTGDSGIFANCTKLTSIVVPEEVQALPNAIFYGCNTLTKIILPSGLTQIPSNAFCRCSALQEIEIPKGVKSVGTRAFAECTSLTELVLPSGVESIGNEVFRDCTNLSNLELPVLLNYVGAYAFKNCDSLVSVALPNRVESLGFGAFQDCDKLTQVNYPSLLSSVLVDEQGYYTYNKYPGVFAGCPNLKSITVPEGVEKLPYAMFAQCEHLEEITLPNTLTTVPRYAFAKCASLKSITIPEGVEILYEHTFEYCTSLETVALPEHLTSICANVFRDCTNLKAIRFPDSLDRIGDGAFSCCNSLTAVVLPDTLRDLGASAFHSCKNLESINYPMGLKGSGLGSFYRSGYGPFTNCPKITSFTVPEGVTSIRGGFFLDCVALKEVHLPSTLAEINTDLFRRCTGLVTVNIPYGVKYIGPNAFADCTQLQNITIPEGVIAINARAFYGCSELVRVNVPSSVTNIGEDAFATCPNLKIFCEYDSYPMQYAIDHGIPYSYLTLRNYSGPNGVICMGDPIGVSGLIVSSEPILRAGAKVYDESGTAVRSAEIRGSNSVTLSLQMNSQLKLNTLSGGSYTLVIDAETESEKVTFIQAEFSIDSPPLRVRTSDIEIPEGVLMQEGWFELYGTIETNYDMTKVTFGAYHPDGTPAGFIESIGLNPSKKYDLVGGMVDLSALEPGNYTFRVEITANGQKREVVASAFNIVDTDTITDQMLAKGLVLVNDPDNRLLFAKLNYHYNYLYDLDDWQAFQVALVSRDKIVSSKIMDLLTLRGYNSYAVNLYKKQIVAAIEEIADGGFPLPEPQLYKEYYKWMQKAVDLNYKTMKEFLSDQGIKIKTDGIVSFEEYEVYSETLDGVMELSETLDAVKLINTFIDWHDDVREIVEVLFRDYENGMNIINSVASSMGTTEDPSFIEAVLEVRQEYNSRFVAVADTSLKKLFDEVGKMPVKAITKELGGTTYKAVTLAMDTFLKLSGMEEHTNDTMKFVAINDTFNGAVRAYSDAYDVVFSGDHSPEALQRLVLSYRFAKTCAKNLYDTLYELYPKEQKAELKVYMEANIDTLPNY